MPTKTAAASPISLRNDNAPVSVTPGLVDCPAILNSLEKVAGKRKCNGIRFGMPEDVERYVPAVVQVSGSSISAMLVTDWILSSFARIFKTLQIAGRVRGYDEGLYQEDDLSSPQSA